MFIPDHNSKSYYLICFNNIGINSARIEVNALQLIYALQLSSLIVRRRYRMLIIPLVFILGCIYALPRIYEYVSSLRPSSNLYMLEVHKYSLE